VVGSGSTVTFNDNNFTDHSTSNLQGGVVEVREGGTIELNNVKFMANSTNLDGGAIHNKGTVSANNLTLTNNFASENGGALYNDGGNVAFVGPILFSSNRATLYGGAFYNNGTASFRGNSTFSNNTSGDPYAGGAIYNYNGKTINFYLDGDDSLAKFENNRSAAEKNDIVNFGSLNIVGRGTFKIDGGILGRTFSGTVITVTGPIKFDMGSSTLNQTDINFVAMNGENPVLIFTPTKFDESSGSTTGAGGRMDIRSRVVGSPVLKPVISESLMAELAKKGTGRYRYIQESANLDSYRPTIAPANGDVEITFEEKNGLVNYGTLIFRRALDQSTLNNIMNSWNLVGMTEFINSTIETNPEVQSYVKNVDAKSLEKFYRDHNPDSNLSFHIGIALAPLKVASQLLEDRNVLESRNDGLWLSTFGGYLGLGGSMADLGGIVSGFSHKVGNNSTADIVYILNSNNFSERNGKMVTNAFAVHIRHSNDPNLQLSGLIGYGFSSSSEGKLNYGGNALQLNFTASYSLTKIKNLIHEVSLRYSSTFSASYSNGLGGSIASVEGKILTSAFGFRYRIPGRSRRPSIDVRCAFLYTLLDYSDKFYSVTLVNGHSYNIANIGSIPRVAFEVGLGISYSLNDVSVGIHYGETYSKNLVGGTLAITLDLLL
jgi:hypothetical protein